MGRLSREKSARMFQELSALNLHPDNAAKRFQSRTVPQELSVFAVWFQASAPRRSTSSNVLLSPTRSAAQSPDRFAMTSILLVKCAVTALKRSVRTDPPP